MRDNLFYVTLRKGRAAMPTIKELADACGATKPTVTRRLKELGLWDGHVNKQGSVFVVDDEAASAVAHSFADAPQHDAQKAPVGHDAAAPVVASLERYIASLERQLETKDAQIADLARSNRELSDRLASVSDKITDLAEQVARANALAERPRGLFDRLLGSGKEGRE